MRASWTGQISFGLVGIPVKAVPAQSSRDLKFELHHAPCKSRLETRRFCPKCERDVSAEEIVKGYQYSKNHFVWFEEEELDEVATPAKHTLRILDFVDLAEIDPIYYEKPYFLQPAPGGERTYALLHRAMSERGRVGIGRVAFRDRESLAVIRPLQHALVMETIAWPEEVRALNDVVPPLEVAVDERELQMAELLSDSLTAEFKPEKYRDEYRDALTALIETKVAGGAAEVKAPADRKVRGEVVELMELLRKSVEASGGAPQKAEELPAETEKKRSAARGSTVRPRRRASVEKKAA